MRKILVIQTAFIGDAILATAALESIHSAFPNDRIDFLVRKGNESLFVEHPFIHTLLVWDKKEGKYKSLFRLLKRIRSEDYNAVLNLQRFASSGILTAFSGADLKVGFKKNPLSFFFNHCAEHELSKDRNQFLHETERNHQVVKLWQDIPMLSPKLYPSQKDFDSVAQFVVDSFITISPASVWETKKTPLEVWRKMLDELKGVRVYLLGGPGDRQLCSELKEMCSNENIEVLAGQLSLLQSAALMSKAKRNFVNDSGPLHLCSAMNAPVTAVFCSTIPSFGFGPLSQDSKTIETSLSLSCRPCGLHGKKRCPEGHYKCGHSIEVEGLLNSIS